ncbi:AMP-binding protein [Gordonia terrae]
MAPVSLPELVQSWALQDPQRQILRDVGGQGLTNSDLAVAAATWGALLTSVGATRGAPVATMLPNTSAGHIGWLGTAWIGAIEFPLNHAFPTSWIERLIMESGATIAIVGKQLARKWQPLLTAGVLKSLVVVHDLQRVEIWSDDGRNEFRKLTPVDLTPVVADRYDVSCVILTSGTTGPSKGVVVPWGQWETRCVSNAIPSRFRNPDEVFYNPLPVYHTAGRSYFYEAVYQQSVMVSKGRFSTTTWIDDIYREKCTGTILLGTTASFIFNSPQKSLDRETSLKFVVVAPVPTWVDQLKERFNITAVTSYGATEYGNAIVSGDHFEVTSRTAGSCGVADSNYEVRLVSDQGMEVGIDEPGELHVRGTPWANNLGYWRRPEESARAWQGGWFRTGDIFRRDADGLFYFIDRAKDMVRRRGENISSMEVEWSAMEHPEVSVAAAYGVRSEHGEEEVMLSVELAAGAVVSPAELHKFLETRLPAYAVPQFIAIHAELPRTSTQKIRKNELREAGVTSSTWQSTQT